MFCSSRSRLEAAEANQRWREVLARVRSRRPCTCEKHVQVTATLTVIFYLLKCVSCAPVHPRDVKNPSYRAGVTTRSVRIGKDRSHQTLRESQASFASHATPSPQPELTGAGMRKGNLNPTPRLQPRIALV